MKKFRPEINELLRLPFSRIIIIFKILKNEDLRVAQLWRWRNRSTDSLQKEGIFQHHLLKTTCGDCKYLIFPVRSPRSLKLWILLCVLFIKRTVSFVRVVQKEECWNMLTSYHCLYVLTIFQPVQLSSNHKVFKICKQALIQ